jgi:hypothetical protein
VTTVGDPVCRVTGIPTAIDYHIRVPHTMRVSRSEILELRTAQAQCRPAAGRLGERRGHEERPGSGQGGEGTDRHPVGHDHTREERLEEQAQTLPQGHEDQTQPCGRRARGGRK